jgi:transcriptional regulator with XRE-family HTH domain
VNQLRLARRKKGWRQIDLSEAAGVSLTLVWILETSRGTNVSMTVKEKIARALDCQVDQIFPEINRNSSHEA